MMLKSFCRAVLVAALTVFCASHAFAANTWLPNYDRDVKVYIDPALANDPTSPLTFDNTFRQRLAAEAAKHSLDIYVIATKQGDDLTGDSKRWAPELLHTPLWDKWSAAPSFSERNVLVLLWVQYKDDPSRSSIAARSGSFLQGYGVNRQRFFDSNGPVMTAINAHRSDKKEILLTIAANVNQDVDNYIAARQPSANNAKTGSTSGEDGFVLVLLTVLVGALFVGAIIVVNRPSRPSSYSGRTGPSGYTPREGSSTTDTTGAIITGGVLGGLAGSALSESASKKAKERKRDSGSDGGSSTTTTTSSCSSGSSCGSSCGGGGCGGGGCGG